MELPDEIDIVYELSTNNYDNYWISEEAYEMLRNKLFSAMDDETLIVLTLSGSEIVVRLSKISCLHKSTKEQREHSDTLNKKYNDQVKADKGWSEDA